MRTQLENTITTTINKHGLYHPNSYLPVLQGSEQQIEPIQQAIDRVVA